MWLPDSRAFAPELYVPGRRPTCDVVGNSDGVQSIFTDPVGLEGGWPRLSLTNASFVKDGLSIDAQAGRAENVLTQSQVDLFKGPFTILVCCTPASWGHYGDFGRLIAAQDDTSYAFVVYYRSATGGIAYRSEGTSVQEYAPTGFSLTDTHCWAFVSEGTYDESGKGHRIYFGNAGVGYLDETSVSTTTMSARSALDTTDDFILGNNYNYNRGFDGVIHAFVAVPYDMGEAEIKAWLKDPYRYVEPV